MILSDSEMVDLTGYERPSYQAKWLKARGWKFEESRKGPKVSTAYFNQRMGIAAPAQDNQWKPDFSVLGKLCR